MIALRSEDEELKAVQDALLKWGKAKALHLDSQITVKLWLKAMRMVEALKYPEEEK